MARRGRPSSSSRGRRIDGALDALTQMGFSPELIRRSVDTLLKVYGGEAGWKFIEEGYYKELIDFILGEQEVPREQEEPRDFPDEDNHGGGEDEPSEAGPSSEPLCSSQITPSATPIIDSPLASPVPLVTPLASPVPLLENVQSMIPMSNEINRPNDILIGQEKIAGFSSIYTFPSPPGFEHIVKERITPSKRKPCFGWMGPEDDEDFVFLMPSPVWGRTTGEKQRKRKSRWDVGPVGPVVPYDVV